MRRATTDPSVTSRGRTPEPGPAFAAAFAGGDRWRMAAAHSPKFQAVTAPTTAANWWLLRVAFQLRRLNVANSINRNACCVFCPAAGFLLCFLRERRDELGSSSAGAVETRSKTRQTSGRTK